VVPRARIVAFAEGDLVEAFGEPYRPFAPDAHGLIHRRMARLPRDPFLFVDRVTEVRGEPFVLARGAACETQFELRPDAWFFAASRQRSLPFAVLLEIALQPCGWLAAYCGSALRSPERLRFRNLGGEAVALRDCSVAAGEPGELLTVRAELTDVSDAAGMLLQHFAFEVAGDRGGPLYRGTTYFGFFPDAALRDQVGIRDAKLAAASGPGRTFALPDLPPWPTPTWRMVDRIDHLDMRGGDAGLGFVQGSTAVDPEAWFFRAHFFEDPVWPGSLGLEALLQLLQALAIERAGPAAAGLRFAAPAPGHPHRWTYRGQCTPAAARVDVQASVRAVEPAPGGGELLRADGWLSVDGRAMYRMEDFTLLATPAAVAGPDVGGGASPDARTMAAADASPARALTRTE
jgi:3-hydroxymyristoyl/3-hydroxydecanoyl-(acyl carrier protein) dehydratase